MAINLPAQLSANDDFCSLIDKTLASSELTAMYASKSYAHANGFLALTVHHSENLTRRIHWWPTAASRRSDIHSHPWSFCSRVLFGTLLSIHYRENDRETDRTLTLRKYKCISSVNESGYTFSSAALVIIEPVSEFTISAGSRYSLEPSEIHAVHPLTEAITDVSIGPSTAISWIYTPSDLADFNNSYLSPSVYRQHLNRLREKLWHPHQRY